MVRVLDRLLLVGMLMGVGCIFRPIPNPPARAGDSGLGADASAPGADANDDAILFDGAPAADTLPPAACIDGDEGGVGDDAGADGATCVPSDASDTDAADDVAHEVDASPDGKDNEGGDAS